MLNLQWIKTDLILSSACTCAWSLYVNTTISMVTNNSLVTGKVVFDENFGETMITIFERGPGLVANGGDS